MDYQITLRKDWPYRHPKSGRSVLRAGTYFVPDHILPQVAERALAEGVATRFDPPKPKPVLLPAATEVESVQDDNKPARKRAPRNKSRGKAPENKSTLALV